MSGNEDALGDAIVAVGVDRGEVFVTTKLDRGNRTPDAVGPSVNERLDRLAPDTVDLL